LNPKEEAKMKTHTLKHLSLAIGMALAGTASAGTIDFTGSNIYIKFLDGDRLTEANNSIDTNSGGDQGQSVERAPAAPEGAEPDSDRDQNTSLPFGQQPQG